MCKALFSINPEYVEKIFSGQKHFEYRKQVCKNKVTTMLIYATAPIKMVVGEASVSEVFTQRKGILWEKTKDFSGVSKSFYDMYFDGYEYATAYVLTNVKKYETPHKLCEYGVKVAPQSFCYIKE